LRIQASTDTVALLLLLLLRGDGDVYMRRSGTTAADLMTLPPWTDSPLIVIVSVRSKTKNVG